MKPYPLLGSNHLTVPLAISVSLLHGFNSRPLRADVTSWKGRQATRPATSPNPSEPRQLWTVVADQVRPRDGCRSQGVCGLLGPCHPPRLDGEILAGGGAGARGRGPPAIVVQIRGRGT